MNLGLNKPFPAYKGPDPYVFVCYAHKDAEPVYADMLDLNSDDLNFWYDEGILAGSSWRAEIADAIQGASKLLFFVSQFSLESTHCLREIDYALNHDVEIIPVYLDDSVLPPELELALNRVQALFRKADDRYLEHLRGALQGSTGLSQLRRKKNKRGTNFLLPITVMALVLLLGGVWFQVDSTLESERNVAGTATSPNAFDRYLDGMELMARWDKNDNLERATSLFQEAVVLDPGFALSHARLAEAYRMQYALSRDSVFLDQAVSSIEVAVRLNAGLAPVQVVLGRIRSAQGNTDLAFAAFQQALALDPNDAAANSAIGRHYERVGRLEDAETSYVKSITLEPDNLLNIDSLANFLYRQNRFAEASEQWKDVIRLAPDHFAALTNLGASLKQIGSASEAITIYQQAISIRPTYMAWSNLGTVYLEAERYEDSVDAFLRAIEINSSDWLAWGNLAFSYDRMNDLNEQSIETFEHAIQLAEDSRIQSPRDPYVHSDLALYYAKTGQVALAEQRIATATALSPDTGEILAAAAEVYELTSQRDMAVEYVLRAIDSGYPVRKLNQSPDLTELLADPRLSDRI